MTSHNAAKYLVLSEVQVDYVIRSVHMQTKHACYKDDKEDTLEKYRFFFVSSLSTSPRVVAYMPAAHSSQAFLNMRREVMLDNNPVGSEYFMFRIVSR